MNKTFLTIMIGIAILAGPAMGQDLAALEKQVIARANSDPETAPDYFMSQIEAMTAPPSEVQAVYLYGMGLAYERQGDMVEAVEYYRGAELFGHRAAREALIRLKRGSFTYKDTLGYQAQHSKKH